MPERWRPSENTVSDGLQKDRPSESPSGGKTPPPRAEAEKTPEPPQAPAPVIIRESGGKGLAVGALVLSLLALGAGGFLFVQGQNVLKNQETAFNQKIDQAAVGESENAQILKENSRRQSELAAALQQIADGQRDNKEQIEAANRAYQELLRNRADWLVDETEATLNMAAQQLLLSTSDSIEDICYAVGYSNVGYFYKVFRKLCGKSPKAYRKQVETIL